MIIDYRLLQVLSLYTIHCIFSCILFLDIPVVKEWRPTVFKLGGLLSFFGDMLTTPLHQSIATKPSTEKHGLVVLGLEDPLKMIQQFRLTYFLGGLKILTTHDFSHVAWGMNPILG